MEVRLIGITQYLGGDGSPEALIEAAGRSCYRSEPRGNSRDFIRRRVQEGHESIIEHASATFEISGISRACSHQIVRHRLASYSQESQRYVAMDAPEFVTPDSIAGDPEAQAAYDRFLDTVAEAYRDLRSHGVPKEDARFVLPNATTTRIIVTMNFRAWRHFLEVRLLDRGAQWEIREVGRLVLQQLMERAPSVFEDIDAVAGA